MPQILQVLYDFIIDCKTGLVKRWAGLFSAGNGKRAFPIGGKPV